MDGLTDLTYCSMDVMSYTNANERTTLHWRRHGAYGSMDTEASPPTSLKKNEGLISIKFSN